MTSADKFSYKRVHGNFIGGHSVYLGEELFKIPELVVIGVGVAYRKKLVKYDRLIYCGLVGYECVYVEHSLVLVRHYEPLLAALHPFEEFERLGDTAASEKLVAHDTSHKSYL